MCRSLQENVAYEFVFASSAVPHVEWDASAHTAAILWGAASRIFSKQHAVFLCISHLAFSHVFGYGPKCASVQSLQHWHSLEEITFYFIHKPLGFMEFVQNNNPHFGNSLMIVVL